MVTQAAGFPFLIRGLRSKTFLEWVRMQTKKWLLSTSGTLVCWLLWQWWYRHFLTEVSPVCTHILWFWLQPNHLSLIFGKDDAKSKAFREDKETSIARIQW